MKSPFIIGEKLYLRGWEREDLKGDMFNWTNDSQVTHYMSRGLKPNVLEVMQKEYEQLINSNTDVIFVIVDKKTDKPIGIAGLHAMNPLVHSAEYRIMIGEKDYWSKGYGTEANSLIVAYGFDKLNLHKVYLGVNADNVGAVKSYEKTGFKREGVLRDEIYRNGRYYDAVVMSILREEFYGK
ncbi:MAG: GNAT family protein [Candidatus Omnitrophota bacterium]